MTQQEGDRIIAEVGGSISGQMAVGKDIRQTQRITAAGPVTEEDLAALVAAFAELRAQVTAAAPPEERDAALERVNELEEAVRAEEPDLTTMEYVRNWFARHLPKLAGTVTGLVLHPIVGKLVEAAGDALAADFRRRFG